jgi:hypothetical protein
VISKPQPWRRTESSDRNVLLQVVTALHPRTLFIATPPSNALILLPCSQVFLSHIFQFAPPNIPFLHTTSHTLQAGRSLGATHFFVVDTDELPSGIHLSLDVWWEMVTALLPRQNLALPLIEVLQPSPHPRNTAQRHAALHYL